MFKYFKFIVLIIAILFSNYSFGQKLLSKKKSFRITTGKIEINLISSELRGFKPTENNSDYPIVNNKSIEVIVDIEGGIGRKKVLINGANATQYSDGYYYRSITLSTGENIIKISAEDAKGNKEIKRTKVICTYQYDININNGKYYALIVGINDYDDESITDLNKPIEDAKKLKDLLSKYYTFNEEHIIILENPKRKELLRGFEQITDSIGENDNLLIFFAGHGVWNEKRETKFYCF